MTRDVIPSEVEESFGNQKIIRIFARLKKRKAFWCNGVFETED
jgi:hypothetical protein